MAHFGAPPSSPAGCGNPRLQIWPKCLSLFGTPWYAELPDVIPFKLRMCHSAPLRMQVPEFHYNCFCSMRPLGFISITPRGEGQVKKILTMVFALALMGSMSFAQSSSGDQSSSSQTATSGQTSTSGDQSSSTTTTTTKKHHKKHKKAKGTSTDNTSSPSASSGSTSNPK